MTTTTLTVARQRVGLDLDMLTVLPAGALGFSAVTASTVTAAFILANSNASGNQHLNEHFMRFGAATAADVWRTLTTNVNTTGVATVSAPTYTDTTIGTEVAELWRNYGLRPDIDVLNALNQALEYIYFQSWEPLSLAPDAAMRETSATASWGTASNCTPTKITTAARVYPGFFQAMTTTNSSANGFQPTVSIAVTPSEPVVVAALCRLHSGTSAQMTFRDVTNSASFGTTVTHSNQNYQLMLQTVNPPSGCFNMSVRLGGTGASDVVDWQALWVLRPNAPTPMILPASYMDERFKLEALTYSRAFMGTSKAFVYEGLSLDMTEIPSDDYSTNFMAPAANPMFIQFHNRQWIGGGGMHFNQWMMGQGLPWIQLKLPYSERGFFTTEASTTTAPLHLLAPAAIGQLLDPPSVRSRFPRGDELYKKAMEDFKGANKARTHTGPARRTQPWAHAMLVN